MRDVVGLGTGTAPVFAEDGSLQEIRIDREVRIFTDGKGPLSIINPRTGDLVQDGETLRVNLDQFIDLQVFGKRVSRIIQLRPTTHVLTGPLDAIAIEKIIGNPVVPQ